MTSLKKVVGKSLAALGVAGLAVAGAAGAAFAAGAPGQPDGDTEGSLTIHKYVGVDGEWTGNGSEETITGKTPLAGVTFTAYPITDIDLFKQVDWNDVAELGGTCDPEPAVSGHTLGPGIPVGPTGGDGVASAKLDVAVYLVCETSAPENVTEKSAPFIVSIPTPQGKAGWLYDVHAYPKNELKEGKDEKAIDDEDAIVVGDTVSFTVTSKFQNAPVSSFVMTDQIDERLEYTDGSLKVTAVLPGTEVGVDATSWFDVTSVDGLLTATANAAGIAELNELPAGYKLVFAFDVTVLDDSVGTIKNTANVNGTKTNTVETKWGNIEITKVDKEDTDVKLKGAEFKIYEGECPAAENAEALYTLTTPETGIVTSGPLKEGIYCVVETKAPAGYADPEWSKTVEVKAGETSSTTKETVENAQQKVPTLPNTGAAGTAMLTIGGIALVAIGGGLALRNRKVSA